MTYDAQFIAIAIVILLMTAGILVGYANRCLCDNCKEPFAIFGIGDLQFCRACWVPYRRALRKTGRRRSLLRRIFRSAA